MRAAVRSGDVTPGSTSKEQTLFDPPSAQRARVPSGESIPDAQTSTVTDPLPAVSMSTGPSPVASPHTRQGMEIAEIASLSEQGRTLPPLPAALATLMANNEPRVRGRDRRMSVGTVML